MPKSMRWQQVSLYKQKTFFYIMLGIILLASTGLLFAYWDNLFSAKAAQTTPVAVYLPATSTHTPTSTDTPTATETQKLDVTLTATRVTLKASATSTSLPPNASALVGVRINTNCRTGPGQSYDKVGNLEVGQQAVILGRTTDFQYWLVENPTGTGTCWIWAYYSIVTGPMDRIPVITPPPRPTSTAQPTPAPTSIGPAPTTAPSPTNEPTEDPG